MDPRRGQAARVFNSHLSNQVHRLLAIQPEPVPTINPLDLTIPGSPSIEKSLNTTNLVVNGGFYPTATNYPSLHDLGLLDHLSTGIVNLPFQPCAEITRIAACVSPRVSAHVLARVSSSVPAQVSSSVLARVSPSAPARVSPPVVSVPGPGQNGSVEFAQCQPGNAAKSNGRQEKSTRRSSPSSAGPPANGTAPVGSASGQNDPLGALASASGSVSVPVLGSQVPARNVPLGQSVIVSVDSAQFAEQNGPLDASALVSVGSQLPAVAHSASVPVDLLASARLHCVLAHHGLGNTNFTFERIQSFVGAGHTDRLQFSSLEEATNVCLSDGRTLEGDHTLPRETRLKKVYVWLLCVAMHTVQFAVDVKRSMAGLEFPGGFDTAMKQHSAVELCAWQLLERLIQRHTADVLRVDGKQPKFDSFLGRFNAVATALKERKGLTKRLFETHILDQLAEDPTLVIQRIKSNEATNARKKAQIAAGQAVLAAQGGEGAPAAKKAPAPGKRKDSGADGAGSASKRTRRT